MLEFIPYKIIDGQENMDIDTSLLCDAIKKQKEHPILRLYGWKNPTLTLGRNQKIDGINVDFCKNNNIDIVKRPTGGRALLHSNELTYSYIVPVSYLQNGANVISSYKEISNNLLNAFKVLGVELYIPDNKKADTKYGYCMNLSTGADICYQDKKFIGSAQYRKDGYILQHGSILLDSDIELIENIFNNEKIEKNFITLKEINSDICNIKLLSKVIKEEFEKSFNNI